MAAFQQPARTAVSSCVLNWTHMDAILKVYGHLEALQPLAVRECRLRNPTAVIVGALRARGVSDLTESGKRSAVTKSVPNSWRIPTACKGGAAPGVVKFGRRLES